jgi:hypothetical protein
MFADLPEQVKQVVKEHLLADDFKTAKRIHDDWMEKRFHPGINSMGFLSPTQH